MTEKLITFETAKLAKSKGFDIIYKLNEKGDNDYTGITITGNSIITEFWYNENGRTKYVNYPGDEGINDYIYSKEILNNTYLAPTQSLLQKWLRDIHNIHIVLIPQKSFADNAINGYYYYISRDNDGTTNDNSFTTYESALEYGLVEALNLIK